jgi:hypothetical protein
VKYLNWLSGVAAVVLFGLPLLLGGYSWLLASQFARGIWSGWQGHVEALYIAEGCAMHDKQAASDEVRLIEALGTLTGAVLTLVWDMLPISSVYCASGCLLVVVAIAHSVLPTETPVFAKLKLSAPEVSPTQLKTLSIWSLREVLRRDMRTHYLKDDDEFDPPQHCGMFASLCCSLVFASSEAALLTILPVLLMSLQ